MDEEDLTNKLECLIGEAYKSGLKYSEILTSFLIKSTQLAMRAHMEYWLKNGGIYEIHTANL